MFMAVSFATVESPGALERLVAVVSGAAVTPWLRAPVVFASPWERTDLGPGLDVDLPGEA